MSIKFPLTLNYDYDGNRNIIPEITKLSLLLKEISLRGVLKYEEIRMEEIKIWFIIFSSFFRRLELYILYRVRKGIRKKGEKIKEFFNILYWQNKDYIFLGSSCFYNSTSDSSFSKMIVCYRDLCEPI